MQSKLRLCLGLLSAALLNSLAPAQEPNSSWQSRVPAGPFHLHGMNAGLFPPGKDPNLGHSLTPGEIADRLDDLVGKADWLRFFGVGLGQDDAISQASALGFQVAAGAWLDADQMTNDVEIQGLIGALNSGVDLAICGSEVLLRKDLSETDLIDWIRVLRDPSNNPNGIPVAYADIYQELFSHPNVIDEVDWIGVNIYPFWEGVPIEEAVRVQHHRFTAFRDWVEQRWPGKPVFLSEAGWPSDGLPGVGDSIPTPANAARFLAESQSWARNQAVSMFTFSSHDEDWKTAYEGPHGAHWGLHDNFGNLKPGMAKVFRGFTTPDTWSIPYLPGGSGTPTLIYTSVPPIGSYGLLQGEIRHADPLRHQIVTYIHVPNAGWWIKPTLDQTIHFADRLGNWAHEYASHPNDLNADLIHSFLFEAGYQPTLYLGSASLDPQMSLDAVAEIQVTRP
ncbi:MAG: hypothetical protein DWQ01_06900 [Planctomycetota bacterium]|nr:MAG: hypothetical protein DWQ01_06900 [Planctomycetota bacterium]